MRVASALIVIEWVWNISSSFESTRLSLLVVGSASTFVFRHWRQDDDRIKNNQLIMTFRLDPNKEYFQQYTCVYQPQISRKEAKRQNLTNTSTFKVACSYTFLRKERRYNGFLSE